MIQAIHPVKGKGKFSEYAWELLPVSADGTRDGWKKAAAEQPKEVSAKLKPEAKAAAKKVNADAVQTDVQDGREDQDGDTSAI